MVDNLPKKRVASVSSERTEIKKVRRLPITNTKASQARANAIRSAQKTTKTATNPTKPLRKKQTADPPPTLAKSYHTASSSLKQRPAWDLRGKVSDITEMYKLSLKTLSELRGFKTELEIIKEDKESQEKAVLEQVKELRTDLQSLERQHINNIEELHAQQRIEYQRLEDNNLNYSRRLATKEIEVSDNKRRLDLAQSELEKISIENDKLKLAERSIADHEKEIKSMKEKIGSVSEVVDQLKAKLFEAHQVRDRLLSKVTELEETKKGTKDQA
ncbi:hypothetical protein BY458DRAFT_533324 [Sporodiniella umbellata]|nr:hypothetical protein BY458DRAFT_533324 [Sporodiniella umbellata]